MSTTKKDGAAKPAATTKAKAKPVAKGTAEARAPSKARAPAKKTTATRTAAKKAASTKTATKPKPAAKTAAASTTKKAPVTAKTDTKPTTAAPKTAAKPSAKKAAAKKAVKKPAAKKATTKKATTAPKVNIAKGPAPKTNTKSSATEKPKGPVKDIALVPPKNVGRQRRNDIPLDENGKPKIAAAPLRPALRVARRAEANRDKNQTFKVKTKIVYPAHGVGYITEIEKQEIAGHKIELFVIEFEHEKMKLRVPVGKAANSGMRNLSSVERIDEMLALIEGKARVKRTMWSRRAQEYEAKINSGDLNAVSEVVRDLFRADDQPEQSYSERQLFEQARERLGREIAAVRRKSLENAIKEIHVHLDRKERPEPPAAAAAAS